MKYVQHAPVSADELISTAAATEYDVMVMRVLAKAIYANCLTVACI